MGSTGLALPMDALHEGPLAYGVNWSILTDRVHWSIFIDRVHWSVLTDGVHWSVLTDGVHWSILTDRVHSWSIYIDALQEGPLAQLDLHS